MSFLADSGPQPDGSRSAAQWENAMREDFSLILMYLKEAQEAETDEERKRWISSAEREAGRLRSDVSRFAHEVLGFKR